MNLAKSNEQMIEKGNQIRAARGLLGWSQRALAGAAGIHRNTVKLWEAREVIEGDFRALRMIRQTLEGQGVQFSNGGAILPKAA